MPIRRHRLITVLFVLFGLLFMQLAVAGYACPVGTGKVEAVDVAAASVPWTDEMSSMMTDGEQPGLCHAHCQASEKMADKAQSPAPVATIATGFAYIIEPARIALTGRVAQAPSLLRTTAPPIAVRNCCFRL